MPSSSLLTGTVKFRARNQVRPSDNAKVTDVVVTLEDGTDIHVTAEGYDNEGLAGFNRGDRVNIQQQPKKGYAITGMIEAAEATRPRAAENGSASDPLDAFLNRAGERYGKCWDKAYDVMLPRLTGDTPIEPGTEVTPTAAAMALIKDVATTLFIEANRQRR